jgi:hypothetical protein
LPESSLSLAMSSTSSLSWNATPIRSPNSVSAASTSSPARDARAPKRADVAISDPVLSATTSR